MEKKKKGIFSNLLKQNSGCGCGVTIVEETEKNLEKTKEKKTILITNK